MEKYFTIEQANRALTLVRPIVGDILEKMRAAEEIHEAVKNERKSLSSDETTLLAKLSGAEKLLNEIEYHMKELERVGVLLKDMRLGLVDFPCMNTGKLVYLCWMPGETCIRYWHEIHHGFGDRKTVDESFNVAQITA